MFKKYSFWTKVKATCLALGVGGEIGMFAAGAAPEWKGVVVVASIVGVVIAQLFDDKNNNDVVDMFENKPKI
jgi:hypothetical protein